MPDNRNGRPTSTKMEAASVSDGDLDRSIVARCTRCGRAITAAASLAAGMGKACRRRSLALAVILGLNRARARRELRQIADRLAREGDPHAASVVSAAAEAVGPDGTPAPHHRRELDGLRHGARAMGRRALLMTVTGRGRLCGCPPSAAAGTCQSARRATWWRTPSGWATP